MVNTRSDAELSAMRASGKMSAKALKAVLEATEVGVNLLDLEKIATETIKNLGGASSFKSVEGYSWTTCLTVNDEVVHGIPRDILLKKGDVLGIDLGAQFRGWHTDTAWSTLVGGGDPKKEKFLRVGEEALWKGIGKAIVGNRVGDISEAIQTTIESGGYRVVRALVGHGVGRQLHEEPEVPGYGKAGVGLLLKEGMTLAVEAIYTESTSEVVLDRDGWTYRSEDGSLGGLFEMTIIVGRKKSEVITDWRKV